MTDANRQKVYKYFAEKYGSKVNEELLLEIVDLVCTTPNDSTLGNKLRDKLKNRINQAIND